jgi:hypothetical protein
MSDADLEQDEWFALLRDTLRDWSQVSPEILQAGYAAFAWRTIDAELAELTYDSIASRPMLVRSGSPQQAALRALSFASRSLTIELEVEPTQLMGQLVPPQQGDIILTLRTGPASRIRVDELGCFTIDPLPQGPFRLQVVGEQNVMTDWITL